MLSCSFVADLKGLAGLVLLLLCGVASVGCGAGARGQPEIHPTSEKVLAARRLKDPLDQHLCKAGVYPIRDASWRVTKIATVSGRGSTFREALEALCREADGLSAPALSDIYYHRLPSGWASVHELRASALRYDEGFSPPPPPRFADIRPPQMPTAAQREPPPAGENTP